MPRKRTVAQCTACGRVRPIEARGECGTCYDYRGTHGVVRPYGAADGRTIGTAAAASRRRGILHPRWKGDHAVEGAKRDRTRRVFPLTACEHCGHRGRMRHHWDLDPGNNDPKNIAILCGSCHRVVHLHGYV